MKPLDKDEEDWWKRVHKDDKYLYYYTWIAMRCQNLPCTGYCDECIGG